MCAYTRCVGVAGYNKRCTKCCLVGIHLILIIVVEISDSSQVERTQQAYVVTNWGGIVSALASTMPNTLTKTKAISALTLRKSCFIVFGIKRIDLLYYRFSAKLPIIV